MKNMKIRVRMIVSYLIIIAILLVVGITSIVMLSRVGENIETFYNQQFQTVNNAMSARRLVFSVRADLLQAIVDDDLDDIASYISDAKSEFSTLKTTVDAVSSTFQGDKSYITSVTSLLTEAEPYLNEICSYASTGTEEDNALAYDLFLSEYKPRMDEVRTTLGNIGDIADENALAKVEQSNSLSKTADVLVICLIVAGVAISLLLALMISESIRKPIAEMQKVCNEMAHGNMDTELKYQSKDELGEMANDMRFMTDNIRSIIKDIDYLLVAMGDGNFVITSQNPEIYRGDYQSIRDSMVKLRDTMNDTLIQIDVSADQVNAGGEQVSAGAQALAQGATEQASSVEELAATINEISTQISKTAEHAKAAEIEDKAAGNEIAVCSGHMEDLMEAMQLIETKSKEISKVIKTIEDIAFQTNILALNAAVEAARAGSAGKGFAVVADEVRNLASKSQEAAQSTTTLINETVKAIENGTAISAQTNESLQKVVTNSEKVLESVTLISSATDEQANAAAQITSGIDQISSVVQTNSATAEESAAASEELSGQANLLKDMLGHFTLNRDGNATSGRSSVSSHSNTSHASSYTRSSVGGDKY